MAGLNQALDWYEDEVDLSTVEGAENVAIIRGSMGETVVWSWDCWIAHPANAKRVIVDPGNIDITVACDYSGLSDGSYEDSFTFNVIAGHTYKATTGISSCIRIRDVEANEVIAEGTYTCR